METRDLMYFEAIAETGHVGKAAEKLFLTQPALTRAVRRLEERLGAALVERYGRGIKLTPMGRVLLEKTRSLRHILEDTERELLDFAQGRAGHIRLGCAPTVGTWLLAEPAAALRSQVPGVTLDITFDMGKHLLEQLYAHHLDMVISYIHGPPPEGFTSVPLFNDAVVVAAGSSHPIFSGPYTVRDLARYRWIFPKQSMFTRNWLEQAMTDLSLPPPEVYIETNTVLYTFNLAVASESLCFLSRRNLSFFGGGFSLREVNLPELVLNRVFSMVHRTVGYLSPAAERFSKIMRGCAKVCEKAS